MVNRIHFAFLNLGHLYDHLFMLVFATTAALSLSHEWGMKYAELIPYATPGFVAFGTCSVPAGWLADKWSRKGMMVIFFIGIGLSSILTSLAKTPIQIGIGIFFIGLFAGIYHPVGLALVVQGREKAGVPVAINGVFGNMGVACAALITGFLIDHAGWRSAFIWPGIVSIATGIIYAGFLCLDRGEGTEEVHKGAEAKITNNTVLLNRRLLIRVFVIIFVSTAIGGLLFQSTTFALPKIFDERLGEFGISATLIGWYAFIVFAIAAFGQLIVGYLVDHFSIRLVFVFVAALQAIFFVVMPGLTGWNALFVATAFMLVVFGQIPINDVLISRITQSQWRSRVYAFRYIVTFSVMASSLPIIALIHARWGFDGLFIVLSAAATCIFVSVLMLPRALSGKLSI
ncbi:MAG: MFS transporter [Thiotrichaceae bacterium]